MRFIKKKKILDGVYWVEIPEINLNILCGCPSDAIKHLRQQGYVYTVEKDGVNFETGPHAILLSEDLVQKGNLANLSEFPVLHMLYKQGLIIPGHPNNTDAKPLLIGKKAQVESQMNYIFRGNYGLTTEEEYREFCDSEELIKENLLIKLKFAFGEFASTYELMDHIFLENKPVEIHSGATIQRTSKNRFKLGYKSSSVEIDLNLKKTQKYRPTYKLPKIVHPNHRFAIIHSGEGDGWDHTRPCLSSIIQYGKKLFLIDAGPNVLHTLRALGISPKKIEGIFFTHVHDDHFAGLYSLISKNNKIKIIATPRVQATIYKKFTALFTGTDNDIATRLNYHMLDLDQWNDYKGLEVKPILSPHPVDTTIFIFRVKDDNDYKTYGHFSDITAISWLEKMIIRQDGDQGVSQERFDSIVETYKMKLDLKKVDVGGVPIHGNEEDFLDDPSEKLILAHTTDPLSERQLEIGIQAQFGDIDVLID